VLVGFGSGWSDPDPVGQVLSASWSDPTLSKMAVFDVTTGICNNNFRDWQII
jgi:hypothetical protein